MADELEQKVTAAYRELGAEEPPRALDEAILAASRRQAKPWTQRWAVPLSLAAVVVLSVTVTLRIQHEAPELPSTAPPTEVAAAKEAQEQPAALKLKPESQLKSRAKLAEKTEERRAEPKAFADAAPAAGPESRASRNDVARIEEARREMARSADSAAGSSALGRVEDRTARDAEAAARAPQAGALFAKRPESAPAPKPAAAPPPAAATASAPAQPQPKLAERAAPAQVAKLAGETPEREFERIAQLRAEGKHDEADKAFLEFRKRYPEFRITEEMLRRIERPQSAR
jgi:hypothetical protein